MKERMELAYEAAGEILREETSPEDAELLRKVERSSVVVVRGSYDRVEDVLKIMEVPHELVDAEAFEDLALRSDQLVIVNCPGQISRRSVTSVRQFVEKGGSLFTTDWALKHVLEPAFPGVVEYNNRPSADEVVRIEIKDKESKFLEGVFHEGADPLWWLEGSSYPIKVLDPGKVQVLLTSAELEQKYGESPVAIRFTQGEGEVFHMISHYYLQRAETRTERHKKSWKAYAEEMGSSKVAAACMPVYADLMSGEVEAAHKSARFIQNLITEKQRKNKSLSPV